MFFSRHTGRSWLATVSIALLTAGCFDDYDCDAHESMCVGNVARTCDYSGSARASWWNDKDCGALKCHVLQGTAQCVTSRDPDPRCEGATATDREPDFCSENTAVRCTPSGHAVGVHSCVDKQCVETAGTALCSLSEDPDPLCGSAKKYVCEGTEILECEHGYRVSQHACGWDEPTHCVPSETNDFCALGPEPDPHCIDDVGCDGALRLRCRNGYRVEERECETGACAITGDGPTCVLDATPSPSCDGVKSITDSNGQYRGYSCEGNDQIRCADEYLTGRHPCGSARCRQFTPDFATCILSEDPDPNCPLDRAQWSYCNGNALIRCVYGYVIERHRCGEDYRCFKDPQYDLGDCWPK